MSDNGFVGCCYAVGIARYHKAHRESTVQTQTGTRVNKLQLWFMPDYFGRNGIVSRHQPPAIYGCRLEHADLAQYNSDTGNGSYLRNNITQTGVQKS